MRTPRPGGLGKCGVQLTCPLPLPRTPERQLPCRWLSLVLTANSEQLFHSLCGSGQNHLQRRACQTQRLLGVPIPWVNLSETSKKESKQGSSGDGESSGFLREIINPLFLKNVT